MKFRIHITVHVYAGEEFCDNVLRPHSQNYGIVGKEIISPLRKINGIEQCVENLSNALTVQDLWDAIDEKLFGDNQKTSVEENGRRIEKYLVFNNLRYTVENLNKPLLYYLHLMNASEGDIINIQLLTSANAKEIFRDQDNGIRYYIFSKEAGKHHLPHVHVRIYHEIEGSFLIATGEQIAGDKFKGKDLKIIKQTILENQECLFTYWNLFTDGLRVDLNQAFGLKQ